MRIILSTIIMFSGIVALAANQVNIFLGLAGLSILILYTYTYEAKRKH